MSKVNIYIYIFEYNILPNEMHNLKTVLLFVLPKSQINRIFYLSSERIVLGQVFVEIFLFIFALLIPINKIILNRQSV